MSFNTLAPHYSWMEGILAGSKLQRCRTAFLENVLECREILTLGEGHGRFLVELRQRLPNARITVVDGSRGMLNRAVERLKRRGADTENIDLVCADAREWRSERSGFDLIVTHFFLDCFEERELGELVPKIASLAAPSCKWLLADFRMPRKGLARLRAAVIHQLMYAFFRGVTGISAHHVIPPDKWLQAQGFRRCARVNSEWGLLTSELWARAAWKQ